jgi:hypothetical protein
MPIAVRFALVPTEVAAIEWGAMRIVGPRTHMVSVEQDTGKAELELAFPDGDLEAATKRGIDTYARIREIASLPANPDAEPTGAFRFNVSGGGRAYDFLWDAEDLYDENRLEIAIVAAQTTCEVLVRVELEALVAEGIASVPIDVADFTAWSMRTAAGQLLFHAATGEDLHAQPWWPQYDAHVIRRNNVVHRGAEVTRSQARTSLDAMWSFIDYVRGVAGRLRTIAA